MTTLSEEIIALSEEHVMGLLSPSEAVLMEEIMLRDADLARRVGRLRDQLLPLDLSASPIDLTDAFRAQLRARLTQEQQQNISAAKPAASAPPANLPSAPRRWVTGLIAASVASLAIGFAFGLGQVPKPTVVAVLLDADGVPQAVIDDYGNDTATVRFVADISVPEDRTLQVWTLPSEEMGPTSLGVLDGVAATRLTFDDLPDPGAQQLYEVTLEPLGGSPTGRPTGPIIGKGFAAPQA